MAFGIFRMAKIAGASMSGAGNIAAHHERSPGYVARSNPDIDPSRTVQNYDLVDRQPGRITDRVNARITAGLAPNRDGTPRKVRADAVKAVDVMFTFSGEPDTLAPDRHREYFGRCLDFAAELFGGRDNIMSAVVHMDEKTPHLHVLAVPLIDGRLNVQNVMGGASRLRACQDEFFEKVSKNYGLERGEVRDTPRKHLSVIDYKVKTGWDKVKDAKREFDALQPSVEQAREEYERNRKALDDLNREYAAKVAQIHEDGKKRVAEAEKLYKNAEFPQFDLFERLARQGIRKQWRGDEVRGLKWDDYQALYKYAGKNDAIREKYEQARQGMAEAEKRAQEAQEHAKRADDQAEWVREDRANIQLRLNDTLREKTRLEKKNAELQKIIDRAQENLNNFAKENPGFAEKWDNCKEKHTKQEKRTSWSLTD